MKVFNDDNDITSPAINAASVKIAHKGTGRRGLWIQSHQDLVFFADTEKKRIKIPEKREMARPRKGITELEEARTRLANAQAEKYELKNMQLKRETVTIAEVNKSYAKIVENIKQKLLALPTKLALRLENKHAKVCKVVLEEAINDALKEIAEYKI